MLTTAWLRGIAILLVALALANVARCKEAEKEEEVLNNDEAIEASAIQSKCPCDLENTWSFLKLSAIAYEHSVPQAFTIDTSPLPCSRECVLFDRQPDAPDALATGNWSIERNGNIQFHHRPHKTGVAELRITIEEDSQDSDYIVNATYRITIQEEADWPMVFVSRNDRAKELTYFNNVTEQFRNATFAVEQNTGNNTAYADLVFTAGAFDYDEEERHVVSIESSEAAVKGLVVGLNVNSSAVLLEPEDCEELDATRLANRNISEWDVSLLRTHPCDLLTPYPPPELTWFTHLVRYVPLVNRSGFDWFGLTYTDKYRLQSKVYVSVYILQNPCVNEGWCRGPSTDPHCTSLARAEGFYERGYRCQCLPGWVGDRCEIDFDDCSSSPCPAPYVCRDKFRGFDCVCPENLVNCEPILRPWQLSAILLGIFAVICIVASVLILASQSMPTAKVDFVPEPAEQKARLTEPDVEKSSPAQEDEDDGEEEEEEEEEQQQEAEQEVHQFQAPVLVDHSTSPPPQEASQAFETAASRRESEDSQAALGNYRSRYRESFARSSFLIRPSIVPSHIDEGEQERMSDWSGESNGNEYEMQPRPSDARQEDLRRLRQNRKVLSQF